jgi:hypothetical protein
VLTVFIDRHLEWARWLDEHGIGLLYEIRIAHERG